MAVLRCRKLRTAALVVASLWGTSAAAENREALREIVDQQCLVHWQQSHSASPCLRVVLPAGQSELNGYAVLADRKGGAHLLVIPTRTISGIESPALLDPATVNYFDAAWGARTELAEAAGRRLARDLIGMAVNSQRARSQDQLHIHVECLQPLIHDSLQASAPRLTDDWNPIEVPGWRLFARRVVGENLGSADPVKLLAAGLAGAKDAMGDYSLLVAGITLPAGPGFVLLAGTGPGTERLLDSTCTLAEP
ncbi:MAG: CDP-diacylglycerol diphosphatase [Steroidobacteraceae bacterium]|jgi:CDP-diacylglycerol pyrophosphatase